MPLDFLAVAFLPARAQLFHERLRDNLPHVFGTILTTGGALTSWQVHAQWFLSVAASVAALFVALLTIRSLLRKERVSKAVALEEAAETLQG